MKGQDPKTEGSTGEALEWKQKMDSGFSSVPLLLIQELHQGVGLFVVVVVVFYYVFQNFTSY